MKANMKKWLALCLVVVLALSSLTACNKGKEKTASETGATGGAGESGNKKVLDDLGGI